MNDSATTHSTTLAHPSRLRLWRASNGLTLEEMSDLGGVSVSMLSRVERGERSMSPRAKVLLARRLGVRVGDLFDVESIEDEGDQP